MRPRQLKKGVGGDASPRIVFARACCVELRTQRLSWAHGGGTWTYFQSELFVAHMHSRELTCSALSSSANWLSPCRTSTGGGEAGGRTAVLSSCRRNQVEALTKSYSFTCPSSAVGSSSSCLGGAGGKSSTVTTWKRLKIGGRSVSENTWQ